MPQITMQLSDLMSEANTEANKKQTESYFSDAMLYFEQQGISFSEEKYRAYVHTRLMLDANTKERDTDREEIEVLSLGLEETIKERDEALAEIESLKTEIANLESANKSSCKAYLAKKEEVESLKSKLAFAEEENKEDREEVLSLRQELNDVKEAYFKLNNRNYSQSLIHKQEVSSLESEIEDLKQKHKDECSNFKQRLSEWDSYGIGLLSEFTKRVSEVKSLKGQLARLNSDLQIVIEDNKDLREKLIAKDASLADMTEKQEISKSDIKDLKLKNAEAENALAYVYSNIIAPLSLFAEDVKPETEKNTEVV